MIKSIILEFTEIYELIEKKAKQNPPLGNTLKFVIGEQVIFIDGRTSENILSKEDKEASCTLTVSQSDFSKILSGSLNPMMATMMGKIKISGDMGLAMKLQSLI